MKRNQLKAIYTAPTMVVANARIEEGFSASLPAITAPEFAEGENDEWLK